MEPSPTSVHLKPIQWLIGKWKSISASGQYPTIKPFNYCEELEFKSIGQPTLNYHSMTWHAASKKPMHLEAGFLRIKPGTNEVSFMVSHNFGLTSLEEGIVQEQTLELKSTAITRMSFSNGPAVTELKRVYKLCADTHNLEVTVFMATSKTPLTEHLKVIYEKIE